MVRKSRAVQWTPIIVMSGRAEHCDKMQAFELGADRLCDQAVPHRGTGGAH